MILFTLMSRRICIIPVSLVLLLLFLEYLRSWFSRRSSSSSYTSSSSSRSSRLIAGVEFFFSNLLYLFFSSMLLQVNCKEVLIRMGNNLNHLMATSSGSYGRSRRGWGLLSPSGGSRWVAPVSTRRASFSALKPILQRAKSNRRSTWSGTKFPRHNRDELNASLKKGYSKKQLGIGASSGFIGGSTYGYGSGLASYSVYHRQGNL